MGFSRSYGFLLASFLVFGGSRFAHAAEVSVAVAANFTAPMRAIAAAFERDTGHHAKLAFGSSGRFYAQIKNGAPFQVFLSADDETPTRLAREGFAESSSQFTYAIGRLVLWSAKPGFVDAAGSALQAGTFEKLAIANPRTAPYGRAAIETLTKLGLLPTVTPKFVQGENIAQTFQFVQTGNADLGFVALSQVTLEGRVIDGSAWVVPETLHEPIRQDAILLSSAVGEAAASALLSYLRTDSAKSIIRSFGYGL